MSTTTMHLPAHSWAPAHRALLTAVSVLLTIILTVVVTLFVSQAITSNADTTGGFFPDRTTGEGSCSSAVAGTAC